jgi:hypothetical protein
MAELGYNSVRLPVTAWVLLPEEPGLFGLELPGGSRYRFFLKTADPNLPEKLLLSGAEFTVTDCKAVPYLPEACYVLQCDLPLAENYRMMPGSKSCIKLDYCPAKGKLLRAGSVIDRVDFFGLTVDI